MNTKLQETIIKNLKRINVEQQYDDMLDECYSFKSVGGIFKNMLPSRVLQKCDPVAYRCGMNDWINGEGFIEISGDYYRQDDCEEDRDALVEELEQEVSELEDERELLEDEADEKSVMEHDEKISKLNAEIKAVQLEAL